MAGDSVYPIEPLEQFLAGYGGFDFVGNAGPGAREGKAVAAHELPCEMRSIEHGAARHA